MLRGMSASDSRGRRGRARGGRARPPSSRAEEARAAPVNLATGFGRVALVLTLAWAALFAPQLVQRKAFVIGDAGSLRSFAEFSAERWRQRHERTHWNPYVFTGIAATVSLQDSRPQYLPAPLLTAFDAVHRLPVWPPLAIPLLVHLAGMLAAAALARSLWAAGPLAMTWAGLAWGLMPNLVVPFAYGHDAQVMATSLVPVVLLGVDRIVAATRAASLRGAAIGFAGAIGAMLLAAYPQVVVLMLLLCAAFAFQRVAVARRPGRIAWIAGAAVLGTAIGMAVWWPGMLYNAHSIRGGGMDEREVARWSMAWRDLLVTGWPWAVGFGGQSYWGGLASTDFPHYLGAGVLTLAAVGLGRGRDRAAALLLAAVAAIGALLALGTHLGPVHAVLRRLPLFSSFRLAVNALILTQFAVVMLSARGVERLGARASGSRSLIAAALPAAALLLAIALLADPDGWARWATTVRPGLSMLAAGEAARHAATDLVVRAGLALVTLLVLVWGRARGVAWAGVVALALMAIDLAAVDAPFLRRANGDLDAIRHPRAPESATLAASEPVFRGLGPARGLFFSNDWIRWKARSVGGNHPAVNRAWDDLLKRGLFTAPPVLRALAVKYVSVGPGELDPEWFERLRAGPEGLWRVKRALSRAYAVPEVRSLPSEDDVLRALADPRFDAGAIALTSNESGTGSYAIAADCRIRWIDDEPDHIAIATEAPGPSFVVIADAWFPGWSATLDGRPLTIARVDHLVRGVAVPPGRHVIAMRYVPEGWRIAEAVTRLALLLWIACLLALLAWRHVARRG